MMSDDILTSPPPATEVVVRPMTMQDYTAVIQLWQAAEGVGLSAADSAESIARYLARNPGHSFVAYQAEQLVGAVLCGHDGRRGYLHHLAVAPAQQRQGIGRQLVIHCLDALTAVGIDKCHLFVFAANDGAHAFWQRIDWTHRVELILMSRQIT